jgi:hypothetical protein
LYGAETWTLRKVNKKYLESFEMWCWRMEISCTDCVRKEVLQRLKEERNNLRTIKRRKANCTGYTLGRNCLLKDVTESKTGKSMTDGKTRKKT